MTPPPSMAKFRDQLEKRYGNRLTPAAEQTGHEVISTGSLTLDVAMRTGGWVRGRTHELIGPQGVCKTTMSILTAVEHQKATRKAVGWIDMEQSFDPAWAQSLGLDTSRDAFTHISPDDSEDVSDMNKIMAQSELYSLIVIDSIGGMESRKAFDKDAEDSTMGRNAQVITRMVKHAAVLAKRNNITMLYVNQLRANLSGMGVSDIAAGPRALQYNTTFSVRLSRKGGPASETTRKVKIGEIEDEVGRQFVAKVQRSRVSPQGRQAEFWLFNQPSTYGPVGIDKVDEAVSLGLRMGVITQSGAFYTLPGEKKGIQGRAKVLDELRKRPEMAETIRGEALKMVAHEVKDEDDE